MIATESRDPDAFVQWKLPGRLREISGLALTSDERLFAVADEKAIVYELDYQVLKGVDLKDVDLDVLTKIVEKAYLQNSENQTSAIGR